VLVFIKLGGSLITDKKVESSFRESVVVRLAEEIRSALVTDPTLKLVIGHGSGSFGHFAASRHQTVQGVISQEQWLAFTEVATVAAELNYLVAKIFRSFDLPIWRIQPSASAMCRDKKLIDLEIAPIKTALNHDLIPLVYGDVALDEALGGTIISTESIFFYLANHLPVDQILLLGEVSGVYDASGAVIPEITPENYKHFEASIGGSAGVDVTGGMETKVRDMLTIVESKPQVSIRIFDGSREGLLHQALTQQKGLGTLIHAGSH
jgi:isopentenyl phosphate kinase